MKRFFLIIVPVLMAVMLIITQCNEGNEEVNCTEEFKLIHLQLEYPDGQSVLLDSSKVFWVNQNRYLEQDTALWNLAAHTWGSYYIVDDGMRKELENEQEVMRFTGYLNGKLVCERDVLVGADCCHVNYLGTESLTIVIYDDEQENSEEQSHFNVVELNKTIPGINEFLAGLPSESTDEQKLEALTAWLKSYSCINDATILCISCIETLPTQSEISISVNKNGKTEDYILDILMSNPLKAIRFHEHH
jgi:hypothetical protein